MRRWLALALGLVALSWLALVLGTDATAARTAAERALAGLEPGPVIDLIDRLCGGARGALVRLWLSLTEGGLGDGQWRVLWYSVIPLERLLELLATWRDLTVLFLVRCRAGWSTCLLAVLFWLAALIDGLIARRVRFLTFAAYRPGWARLTGGLGLSLSAAAPATCAVPVPWAAGLALLLAVAGALGISLWARDFHRLG